MFKNIVIILFLSTLVGCNSEKPTEFSDKALNEKIYNLNDEVFSLEDVIHQHKGKKILIDVWASWCRDCLKGMPKVKELQKEFPNVVFLFLSVDEKQSSWKNGVKRYHIDGEHYNLPKGMKKGDLVSFLNLNWIPRYVVVDEQGKIALFKAIEASDKNVRIALKKAI